MSLDSVALVVEFERYFTIEIPNSAAEKIYTVQNGVDVISEIKQIEGNQKPLQLAVFEKLKSAMQQPGLAVHLISLPSLVSEHIPYNTKNTFTALAGLMDLEIPAPGNPEAGFLSRFFGMTGFDYNQLTFEALTDVICAANYKTLVDAAKIANKHEVYIAIVGITADEMGVPIYTINAGKSFTNDLGID